MTGHRGARKRPLPSGRGVAVAALLAAFGSLLSGCGSDAVTVVSWGGSYADASKKAYHDPFTAETGIEVRLESYKWRPRAGPRAGRDWQRPLGCRRS